MRRKPKHDADVVVDVEPSLEGLKMAIAWANFHMAALPKGMTPWVARDWPRKPRFILQESVPSQRRTVFDTQEGLDETLDEGQYEG